MRQVTVAEVQEFLSRQALIHGKVVLPKGSAIVSHICSLDSGTEGGLGWLSQKKLAQASSILNQFSGAAVIVPPEVEVEITRPVALLRTSNPKLAFSKVVHHFFSHLTTVEFARSSDDYKRLGIEIDPSAELSLGVVIGSHTKIAADVKIGPNSVIANCTIGTGTIIGANCTFGLPGFGYERAETGEYVRFPHVGRIVIGTRVEIGSNTCIDRGSLGDTKIGDGAKIDNLVHIAHNVILGRNSVVIANAMVAGSVQVGDGAWIAPSSCIRNQLKVGKEALIGMGAVVVKDVAEGEIVAGNPGKPFKKAEKRS